MKQYPKQEDFLNMMNASLRNAAQKLQDEKSLKDYGDVIVELIQNGRGGEENTLHSFLAYWLGTVENKDWKEEYNDPRVLKAIDLLKVTPAYVNTATAIKVPVVTGAGMMTPEEQETLRKNLNKSVQVLTPEIKDKILAAVSKAQKAEKEMSLDDKLKNQGI